MDQWNYARASQQAALQPYSAQPTPATSVAGAAYAQQVYGQQQAYGQQAAAGYSASASVGSGVGLQHASLQHQSQRTSSARSGQADPGAYVNNSAGASVVTGGGGTSAGALQYGGQYGNVYGASGQSSMQQTTGAGAKGAPGSTYTGYAVGASRSTGSFAGGSSGGNASAVHGLDSSKYMSSGSAAGYGGVKANDYDSLSQHGYPQKGDQYAGGYGTKASDIGQYGQSQSAYVGRDLPIDAARRFPDTAHSRQSDLQDQALLLRQSQVMQVQQLQSAAALRQASSVTALDAAGRSADYLSGRGSGMHPASQEYGAPMRDLLGSSYVSRLDADVGVLGSRGAGSAGPVLGGSGARGLEDLYGQGSPRTGYGVSLPPGRDYSSGKAPVVAASWDGGYSGSVATRMDRPSIGSSRFDDIRDERGLLRHEYDRREEELRRERERERERERQRELERREREREREREQRERERERESRRRERTPLRPPPRKRREPSFPRKEERIIRRSSPRREPMHRSPIKGRREYICRIEPYSLVEVERDFASVNKRYSRLYIAPEFSKLVVNWLKEEPNVCLNTPVSFEHDAIIEDESEPKLSSPKSSDKVAVVATKLSSPKSSDKVAVVAKSLEGCTVWNAKVILMSGISENAMSELLSEKIPEDRVIHLHNALRFAILRKDHTFLAAGGSWDSVVDGGDPAADESALIRTAIRCFKEATQLDLSNCKRWNRFVEVHYDRIGKDGLPSHKEITAIFLPDISSCLPSLESWKTQYFQQKKIRLEREREAAIRREQKENTSDKKDATKDKENKSTEKLKKEKDGKKENIKSPKDEKREERKSETKETEKKEKDEKKVEKKKDEKKENEEKKFGKKDVEKKEGNESEGKKSEKKKEGNESEGKKSEKKKEGNESEKEDEKKREKKEKENEEKKDENEKKDEKEKSVEKADKHDDNAKDRDSSNKAKKDEKRSESKDKDVKETVDLKGKSSKEKKDKEKLDELPPNPGFFLTTKWNKKSKIRSMTLSLDGLLDYNEKDNEECTFELSLFAEAFQEMIQYQMGSRILASLEELRKTRSLKRKDDRKRVRDDKLDKVEGQVAQKHIKVSDSKVTDSNAKGDADHPKPKEDQKNENGEKDKSKSKDDNVKMVRKIEDNSEMTNEKTDNKDEEKDEKVDNMDIEDEEEEAEGDDEDVQEEEGDEEQEGDDEEGQEEEDEEEEEEPVEQEEEDEENEKMEEDTEAGETRPLSNGEGLPSQQMKNNTIEKEAKNSSEKEAKNTSEKESKKDEDADVEMKDGKDAIVEMDDANVEMKAASQRDSSEKEKVEDKKEKALKQDASVKKIVDKELLKAYRYFDRNRAGYIKVDDLRRLIHNLGKFLSHRNVKELLSCALLESNKSPRDERILYPNLVKKVE